MVRGLIFLLFFLPSLSSAASFYIDPIHGSDSNDGSSSSPWKSLEYLLNNNMIESRQWNSLPYSSSAYLVAKNSGAVIKGGDTIYLRSGQYGELSIISYYNSAPITVIAEQGNVPVFRNIQIRSSSNWVLSGLTVSPSAYPNASFGYMIDLENHSWTGPVHTIAVRNCNLYSVANSTGWSSADWNNKAKSGIGVDGTNMTISYNTLTNVNFGISVGASHSLIERNTIENFSGDGLRGLGDYCTFQYNTIKNCYDVNENHDDGFQSWSVGADGKVGTGVVTGIILRENKIINYEDPNQPHRGTLQGIGCFDGMFQDWIVEGNIVKVDHWHGISLYGAVNSVIQDNVVTDLNSLRPGPPWILLSKHKNGTPPRDNLVKCNIAPSVNVHEGPHNIVQYNSISETGGPRHPQCPALANVAPMLPLLLQEE